MGVTDLIIEATEGSDDDAAEDGIMITNAGGGTITFTVSTVTLSSVDEDDEDAIDDDMLVSASGSGDVSASASADGDSSCETIEELLCSGSLSTKFTVLCSLLENTPIPALTLTVFAPTDKAFGNLLQLLGVASAAEVDPETLTAILMFHVAPGQHKYDDLECGGLLPMIGSGSSRTKCMAPNREEGEDFIMQKGSGNRKNDIEPTIVFPDIMACAGSVIHVINEVMLPDFIDNF